MNDSADIRRILEAWPYDPDKDARLTQGEDGREILQVRTPVGLEQYELDGRPDGARPHGMESALEFYLQRLEDARPEAMRSSSWDKMNATNFLAKERFTTFVTCGCFNSKTGRARSATRSGTCGSST